MPSWTTIDTVYGPVGDGYSRTLWVLADNGTEYLAKGPSLVKGFKHVAANELVAAGIAQRMGLPVLDARVLELNGDLYFGSTWMDGSRYHPVIDRELLYRCHNSQKVYEMVVFDTWVCNEDRHAKNLIVRCHGDDNGGPRTKDCKAAHVILCC